MECLRCKAVTKVEDSIRYERSVFRRRKCLSCAFAFWTKEIEVTDNDILRNARKYKNLRKAKRKVHNEN